MREEELLQRLREAFQAEASERLGTIFTNLALFEKCFAAQERISLIEVLYRDAHSLKGAARAVNIVTVEQLCQPLETFLALLKEHNPEPERDLLDLLYDSAGLLEKVIADPDRFVAGTGLDEYQALIARLDAVEENGLEFLSEQSPAKDQPENEAPIKPEIKSLEKAEKSFESSEDTHLSDTVSSDNIKPGEAAAPVQAQLPAENLRIAASKLDKLMLVSEEFISLKLVLQQHRLMLKVILLQFPVWEKEWEAVRNDIELPGTSGTEAGIYPQTVKFLELNHKFVGNLRRQIQDLERRVESEYRFQSSLVDDLLGRVRDVAMLPIATLFTPLSRMVRELARELEKQVDFVFAGETIEVDRRVLEEMKDPLIHILRNALDHGIEEPDIRAAALKPVAGKITCTVIQNDAGSIDITIVDDGQGIDRERLREKALALKLISAGDEISDVGLLDLIFHSGFSTSPIITELSGRGLGMAIVREKIENLGGWIRVVSEAGCGSEFSMHLPVSMAISRGVMVQVKGRKFVFPSLKVERVLQVK
jgi:two-component system chemotaxis sensor kinase CheA